MIPKPIRKQELTEERVVKILKDVQFIGTVAQLVENKWRNNLFDTDLRSQTLKNFNRMIYNGAQGVKRELSSKYRLHEPDELEYEIAPEMERVLDFFCTLPAEATSEIMDKLEHDFNSMLQDEIKSKNTKIKK